MTGRTVKTLYTELNNKAELAKIETTLREDTSINLLVNNAVIGSTAPLMNAVESQKTG